jgi:hypothetical protein
VAKKDLIPLNTRPIEEVREIGRKGGIASGEARRKKKELREYMEVLLEVPLENSDKTKKKLEKQGLPVEMLDNKMLLAAALFKRALAGDVQAIKEVRSIIGELPELQTISEEDSNIQVVIKRAKRKEDDE